MKLLVADKFEKVGIDGLKDLGCQVVERPDVKPEELPALLRELKERDVTLDPTMVAYLTGRDVAKRMSAPWHEKYTLPSAPTGCA